MALGDLGEQGEGPVKALVVVIGEGVVQEHGDGFAFLADALNHGEPQGEKHLVGGSFAEEFFWIFVHASRLGHADADFHVAADGEFAVASGGDIAEIAGGEGGEFWGDS